MPVIRFTRGFGGYRDVDEYDPTIEDSYGQEEFCALGSMQLEATVANSVFLKSGKKKRRRGGGGGGGDRWSQSSISPPPSPPALDIEVAKVIVRYTFSTHNINSRWLLMPYN